MPHAWSSSPIGCVLLAGLAVLGPMSTHAHASVIEILPDRDNTLYEDAAGSLSNGAGQHVFAGLTLQGLSRRALLRFDLAAHVPAGATITSVSLTMFMSRGVSSLVPMSLHRVTSDWGEGASDAIDEEGAGITAEAGDATWLHAASPGTLWAAPGGDFDPMLSVLTSVGGVGYATWASTPRLVADAQAMLDQPVLNFGWLLLGDELDTPPTAKRFDSREHPDPSRRPMLVVEYIPSPGAGAVLALGGVCASRRRRLSR